MMKLKTIRNGSIKKCSMLLIYYYLTVHIYINLMYCIVFITIKNNNNNSILSTEMCKNSF